MRDAGLSVELGWYPFIQLLKLPALYMGIYKPMFFRFFSFVCVNTGVVTRREEELEDQVHSWGVCVLPDPALLLKKQGALVARGAYYQLQLARQL